MTTQSTVLVNQALFKLSIVILTWNRRDDLTKLLDCLAGQTFDSFEVIVIDNGSTDGTQEAIHQGFPWVRYIGLPKNMGVAPGRNIGIANSRGEIILFLDDDAILCARDFLERAYGYFVKYPDVSVISCNVVDCVVEGGRFVVPKGIQDVGHHHTWSFFGGGSLFRREVFEELGYLDKSFFFGSEEGDMVCRLFRADRRILFCRDLVIYHKVDPHQAMDGHRAALIIGNILVIQMRYYPILDAMLFGIWQVAVTAMRALRNGWLGEWLKVLVTIPPKLGEAVLRQRHPLPRQVMARLYYLKTHRTDDYCQVMASRMTIADYLRLRRNSSSDFYNSSGRRGALGG